MTLDQVSRPDRENFNMEQMSGTVKQTWANINSDENSTKIVAGKKKNTKEERIRLTEEKKAQDHEVS